MLTGNEKMDERFLDIIADSDREERSVNRYASSIACRSSGDVKETSQIHSSRVVSCIKNFVGVMTLVHFGPSFEIERQISKFAVRFSFGIKRLLPFVPYF